MYPNCHGNVPFSTLYVVGQVGEMGIFLNQFTFSEYISEQSASPQNSDPFPTHDHALPVPSSSVLTEKKNSRVRIITPNFICCSHLRVNFLRNSFTVTRTWSALASEKGLTCMQFQALGRCTILYSVMFTVRCKQARWKIANWGMDCISWYFILLNYKCNQPISLTVLPKYLSSKSAFFHNV